MRAAYFPGNLLQWVQKMPDDEIEVKPSAKISISTALMIFLICQTVAGVWWGATITANLANLNSNIVNSDTRTQKRVDDLEKKIEEKDARLNEMSKSIQTLREMYFLQFGKQPPTSSP
jgi:predicted PurR-regulated permease PerM